MRRTRMLALGAAALLILGACGSSSGRGSGSGGGGYGGGRASTTTSGSQTSDASGGGGETVGVAGSGAKVHIVGPNGHTLYLFERDQGTTTACRGACASSWPPLVANGTPTAGDGVDVAQLGTADGIEADQVTYHGHLLYYFAGDAAPGDMKGVGIPAWYAVAPDGTAIDG